MDHHGTIASHIDSVISQNIRTNISHHYAVTLPVKTKDRNGYIYVKGHDGDQENRR
jgi:hypothetical protein